MILIKSKECNICLEYKRIFISCFTCKQKICKTCENKLFNKCPFCRSFIKFIYQEDEDIENINKILLMVFNIIYFLFLFLMYILYVK
jgi:hypothetical protein